MKRWWRVVLWLTTTATVAMGVLGVAAGAEAAPATIGPHAQVVASSTMPRTVPPTVPDSGPGASNDLFPSDNDLTDCVGTAEPANCGSSARADGHTYLVFVALAAGLTFIAWRISRGVRARDAASGAAR